MACMADELGTQILPLFITLVFSESMRHFSYKGCVARTQRLGVAYQSSPGSSGKPAWRGAAHTFESSDNAKYILLSLLKQSRASWPSRNSCRSCTATGCTWGDSPLQGLGRTSSSRAPLASSVGGFTRLGTDDMAFKAAMSWARVRGGGGRGGGGEGGGCGGALCGGGGGGGGRGGSGAVSRGG